MKIPIRLTSKGRSHNPGIYQIVNQQTGMAYIGSSTCIEERFYQHKHKLKHGRHRCVKMQQDYIHGNKLTYTIILFCPEESLIEFEEATIELLSRRFGKNYLYNDTSESVSRSHFGVPISWMIPRKERGVEEVRSGVYSIRSMVDKKTQYIGSTNNFISRRGVHINNLRAGRHDCVNLQKMFNLIGEDSIEFIIEIRCAVQEMIEKEKELIAERFGILGKNFILNTTSNPGPRGHIRSDETKLKMSEARRNTVKNGRGSLKGRKLSEETKRKLSESNTGKIRTLEARKNMSEAHKGKKDSIETRLKKSKAGIERYKNPEAHIGTPHSDETKLKMSIAHTARIKNKEKVAEEFTFKCFVQKNKYEK